MFETHCSPAERQAIVVDVFRRALDICVVLKQSKTGPELNSHWMRQRCVAASVNGRCATECSSIAPERRFQSARRDEGKLRIVE